MTWYFNFCAPSIPNDSTINFHRRFQTAELMTLMILFVLYHTYYKLWGPEPSTESQEQNLKNQNQSKQSSDQSKISSLRSELKSQNDESKSDNDENKSVSIAQKIKEIGHQNDSYLYFRNSDEKFLKKKSIGDAQTTTLSPNIKIKDNVSVKEIESFFPIVFGHHAIAMGASIMYSPYAEQSIASALYVLCCFLLAIVNSKRLRKSTYVVWIFMAFLNIFIMMSALLQVGQSNWDFVNNVCFAEQYVSLY